MNVEVGSRAYAPVIITLETEREFKALYEFLGGLDRDVEQEIYRRAGYPEEDWEDAAYVLDTLYYELFASVEDGT